MKKSAKNTIRTVYLYIFSVVGLVLMIIGAVNLIDLGLKATIFQDATTDYYEPMPPLPYGYEKIQNLETSDDLTAEEKAQITAWLADYEEWKTNTREIDYNKSQTQRTAANAIALLIVGIPLFFFHWNTIRRENK